MRTLFLAFLFFALTISSAQISASALLADPENLPIPKNIRFERIGLEDGLSQSAVLATLQDRTGYLWFGTQDGLNRYDGYSFTVFRHDSQDPGSLSSSSILSLAEDPGGFLWIGTWGGGLNRYDPRSGSFEVFRHDSADPASLSEDTVTDLLIDRAGVLWIATHGGLNRMDAEGVFTKFRHDPTDDTSISADNLSVLFEDRQGVLWAGTGFETDGRGLNRMRPDGTFTRYVNDPANPDSLSSNNIAAIFQDEMGDLWVGTGGYSLVGGGLDRLDDPERGIFTHFQNDPADPDSLSSNNVLSLWQDGDGHLWIGTWGGGINLYDPYRQPGIFHHVVHDPFNPLSLIFDVVWDITADRSGVVWVGTVPGGISKFNPRTALFDLYRVHPGVPNSLQNDVVSGFFEAAGGEFWVTTWGGGIARFDRTTDQFFHYRHDPANSLSLPNDVVSAFFVDSTGRYWVGTATGPAWFDPVSGNFYPVLRRPGDSGSAITAAITGIVEDAAGFVWLSTLEGLEKYDASSGRITRYRHDPANPASISSDRCTVLYTDRRGSLWIGTWGGGLNRYEPQNDGFSHYTRPDGLGSDRDDAVWSILEDREGRLWLGTEAGLIKMGADGSFTRFGLKDGLPSEFILGILEDQNGRLWISTGNGIARFDPDTARFKVFTTHDGLQSNEFNSGAYFMDQAGVMYFGGVHGFNAFDPLQIRENAVPPPVVITTLRIFNEPVSADLSGETRLDIPYDQNFLSFEFSALDFYDPLNNQYAYQLEGFDPGWVHVGNRRYTRYTNLPPGDYVFRVRASNSDGVWNEAGAAVPLRIVPPFWQRRWFQAGTGALLLGLVASAFALRNRRNQAQQSRLEELVLQRTVEWKAANNLLEEEVERRTRAEAALARRSEEELQQSEARFMAMYNQSVIGIGMLGLDGKIIDANAAVCRMFGRSLAELQQIRFTEVIHPDDRSHGGNYYQQLLSGERNSYRTERRYVRGDGSVFWANVTVSMVYGLDGSPRFAVGMVEDISEQKHVEEELRASRSQLAERDADYRRRLERRVEERTHELTEANRRLQEEISQRQRVEQVLAEKAAEAAVVAERTRLARDLHDAVTQTLFSTSLIAEVLPDLWDIDREEALKTTEELKQLARGALAEMRTLLLELRPATLTQARFEDLLKQLSEALFGRARLPVNLKIENERKLPPEVHVALFRIAQESLNNVVKYAQASQVDVHVIFSARGVHMEIVDDGIGFELPQDRPASLGLRIMRERAESIAAELVIDSRVGQGTRIAATWLEG